MSKVKAKSLICVLFPLNKLAYHLDHLFIFIFLRFSISLKISDPVISYTFLIFYGDGVSKLTFCNKYKTERYDIQM